MRDSGALMVLRVADSNNIFASWNNYSNSLEKKKPEKEESVFGKLHHAVEDLDDRVETGLRCIPPCRKAISMIEEGGAGNIPYALGMAYRLGNEIAHDFKDIKGALTPGPNPHWDRQHPFWAIQGSLIENTRIGAFLERFDKTLFDFKIVRKALKLVGGTGYEMTADNFIKVEGSWIAKILGESALRIPVLGITLFGLMELPGVLKAEDKPEAALKAAIRIAAIMGTSALFGCVGRLYGKIPEMIMGGLGIMAGSKLQEKINATI